MQLSVIITREGKFFVALSPDVDIASQGETMDEALANLKEAVDLYFEDEDSIRPQVRGRPMITTIEAQI